MRHNITTLTDSYKICHYKMYPKGTERVYSYFESRTGAKFNKTVFFGLQYLIKEYLQGRVVTKETIDEGKRLMDKHLGPNAFNLDGWNYILEKHNGRLPVRICAVPEGTPVDTSNVLMTVENTDENVPWLTNYLETLLTHVWSASTVASLSREVKLMCKHYLEQTSMNMGGLDFMLHDFGFRGVSSVESAGFEGAGHLINFKGTDTIRAIELAMDYYGCDIPAFSVPATEHSIMTSMGEDGEIKVFENLLEMYPTGILSVVIDSYNYRRFILEYSRKLKDKILARDGKVVFRPDSGNPVAVTIDVLNCLSEVFGDNSNARGFKVLHPKIGVLWGDGIDYIGIRDILHAMQAGAWSAENIVFGMGGGLLQKVNRDTQRFAFKSSAQKCNGEWHDIYKRPLDISKISKKGRLALIKDKFGDFITVPASEPGFNWLRPVFEDGDLLVNDSFDDVRRRASL